MKLVFTNPNSKKGSLVLKGILSLLIFGIAFGLNAQTFPTPGLTLPAGKSIVISYDVTVNSNVCPTGTLPTDISNQSNVSGSNFASIQTDDPDIAGSSNPTLTPVAGLTLGNLVYKDVNKNGIFDGADVGINGVLVRLYKDDGDGILDAGDGAALASATTAGGGLYSFSPVCPGDYIVEVAASNFNMGGPLYDNTLSAAYVSSPIGAAPDPDNDVNNDDNGDPVAGFGVASAAITLSFGGEPINDGDADANTNLSLDFGFKVPVQISINDVTQAEGTGGSTTAFNFTITRSDNLDIFSVFINTADGTAVAPGDYTALVNNTVSFSAGGSTTANVTVLVNHDNIVEGNETFTVVLSGTPPEVVITDGTGLGTITNDDNATLTLSGGTAKAEANAGTTTYTITATLNNPVQGGFTANYQTANGTATLADNDYNNFTGNQVFAGTAGESHTFDISSNGDTKVELDETFTVGATLSGAPSGVTVAGSPQTATITNDDAATVSIAANVSGSEAVTPMTFSITLSNPVDVDVTVLFNTSNGTATTTDNDYTGISNQMVTFPGGLTTAQSVPVTIINDTKVEANEVYNVAIEVLPAGGRNVSAGTATGNGTITNDDAATVTLTGGGAPGTNEGNTGTTPRVFTATLNAAVQGGFTVPYSTNDGTATIADNDYVDNDNTLTFAGTPGEAKTITVLVNGDFKVELNENYSVTLNSINGAPSGVTIAGSPQTATMFNDEQDFGDAPNSYGTLIANGGPSQAALFGFYLGSSIDGDPDGQPNGTASGDDTDAEGDDDDGVILPSLLIAGQTANVTVIASSTGFIDGWVDFNNSGFFDASERVFLNTAVVAGNNALSFAVPAGATASTTFARFRYTQVGTNSPIGAGGTGEVEDYQVQIISNQFSITSPTVTEGNAGTIPMVYTISRTTNATADAVDYAVTGGSATSGSDYVPLMAGTINFPMGGALSADITVTVNGDVVIENNETVIITLSNPVNGGIGTGTGTGTINNDDTGTLILSGGIAQNEGNSGTVSYTFTATSSAAVQGGFQVPYTTDNNTATTADNDYVDNDGTLTFTGTANEAKTITVLVNGDNKVELNELFTVALSGITMTSPTQASAITVSGVPQTGTITNDDASVISIFSSIMSAESVPTQTFQMTQSNPVDVPVTVLFNTSNFTATTADNDYTGIVNQTVTFPAGMTSIQSVAVSIINDNKVEANEVYNVTIGSLNASGRNVSIGTSGGIGTINNDDAATVTLTGGGSSNEGNSGTTSRVFTATLSAPVQGGFTVPYTTNDGTATTADLDYVDNDNTLTFVGTMGENFPITVNVNGDNKVEANETYTVTLNAINGAPAGVTIAGSPQTGTIVNDEIDYGDAPDTYSTILASNGARHNTVFGFQLGATIDGEADGQPNANATGDGSDEDGVTLPGVLVTGVTSSVTVNASSAGKLDAWVDFNNNGSFADAGEKVFNNVSLIAGNNNLSIVVPAGATPSNSFARFRFSSAGGLSFNGSAADGEVEDYAIQIVTNQFSISSPSVTEGNAGTTTLTYVISRTTNANTSSVDYAITGGTATGGIDYASIPGATLNFPAGGALSQNVNITVNGDFVIEDNETIIMSLSNPVNGVISSGTGTGTITNDDSGTLVLSGGIAQNEGNSGTITYIFTATSSAAVQGGFQVPYTTNDNTATTADNDYLDNDGTLTFNGLAGENKFITILVNSDIKVELNEIFQVLLTGITGTTATQASAITISGSPQTGTITNDDAAVVSIAGNVSQAENLTPQVFTVTLSNPVDVTTTVLFNTSDGTAATADNDYNGITNQTVTFAAGTTTSQTVNVTINNDNKVENNEVYNVAIGTLNASGRNVSLGTSSGTGTIVNDDAATVTLTPVGGISQNEGNTGTTLYQFFATLNNPVQGSFTVNYTTNNGTALAVEDYIDNDGLLSFSGASGQSLPISVLVNGDFKVEVNETFTVNLNSISGAPAGVTIAGSPQTGTIVNDEVDYGDAPDTYSTLLASNGPRHNAVLGFSLGANIDGDPDGVPGVNANGDDTDAEGDDEDGVTLPNPLVTNTTATVTVNASASGKLDGWIDFNNNGTFADAGEKVFNNVALVAGNNSLSFSVPNGATPSLTIARFRLSSVGGLSFNGAAADGEVEDYQVQIVNTQFTIDDPVVAEGNAGTSNLVFTVTRSTNASNCSVNYAITGGTATTADNDYQPLASGTLNFTAGGALTAQVTVVVNGDFKVELNETVDMTLSAPVNATILDGSGTGTITNDDAAVITITSPSLNEPDVSNVNMTFDVTMSNPSDANVSFNFNTLDGTATTANNDYTFTTGSHTMTPGQVTKQILVPIIADCTIEPNEVFFMILSSLAVNGRAITFSGSGSTLTGTGTILNEDAPPVITCPANVTISCEVNPIPANTGGSATATDDCPALPVITFTDVTTPGSCINNYIITRTWKATDGTNDMSTCTQTITVRDITSPTITCPGPVTVSCAALVPAANTASVTTSDNCTGSVTVTFVSDVISNQTCTNRYTVTRTYRATDVCGNSSTCSQIITVNDITAPTLTCPPPITVTCAALVPAPAPGSISASDNCAGGVTVTFVSDVISNQTCANRYTLTRTYRATDVCGNSATCTQVITVNDVIPPSITCPADQALSCSENVPVANIAGVISSDNCAGAVTVTFVGDAISNQTCANKFTVTRTYRSTDVCGNSSTCTQVFTVNDKTPPAIVGVPANITIECTTPIPAVPVVTTTDNCNSPVSLTFTEVNDQSPWTQLCESMTYTVTRTWVATDVCGNSTSKVMTIRVQDTKPPTFKSVPPPFLTVECDDDNANNVDPVPVDACDATPAMLLDIKYKFDPAKCVNNYLAIYTWTAGDNCGNTTQYTQVITVTDTTGPVILCPPNILLFSDVPINVTWPSPKADDDCEGTKSVVQTAGPVSGSLFNPNTLTTIVYQATDECGNLSTCSFTVAIKKKGGSKGVNISGEIKDPTTQYISNVEVKLTGDLSQYIVGSKFSFEDLPLGSDLEVTPSKTTDPLNGVSTLDMVQITNHILGKKLLDSPFKLLAADVNQSKTITGGDLVKIRKLILHVVDEFDDVDSWEFLPASTNFIDPANPWKNTLLSSIKFNNIQANKIADFTAIKMGDVTWDAVGNVTGSSLEIKGNESTLLKATEKHFNAGEDVQMIVSAADIKRLEAFQFTLDFDKSVLDFENIEGLRNDIGQDNFGYRFLDNGKITASIVFDEGIENKLFNINFKAIKSGVLSHSIRLTSDLTKAEAYTKDEETTKLDLVFEADNKVVVASPVLLQNEPNPFESNTMISFILPENQEATISIFDVDGKLIKEYRDSYQKGSNSISIDKSDLPSAGVYYYQLKTKDFVDTKKMMVIN